MKNTHNVTAKLLLAKLISNKDNIYYKYVLTLLFCVCVPLLSFEQDPFKIN